MKCIDCKHLNDSGTEWFCFDNWGYRVPISDPTEELACENYEEIEDE
jgi:hypothetical protein